LAELLSSPRLSLPPAVRAVFAQGSVDPRLVSVLGNAVAHHTIVVGGLESVVDPVHAESIDIVSVDGEPVGPGNIGARDLVTEIAALDPSVRPNEIGTPWPIQSAGFFSDSSDQARLHLAFVSPADYVPSSAGGGVGVAGGVGVGQPAQAFSGGPVAATPAAQGAAQAADAALAAQNAPPAPPVAPSAAPPVAPAAPVVPGSPQGAPVEQLVGQGAPAPGQMGLPGGGPKVQAMIKLADSLLGKPYVFGGGHAGFVTDETSLSGFDCSGFVSAVLHAGGYLSAPVDTTALPGQPGILPGPGQFVTIYDRALSGQNGHVIIDINGQFYESGGRAGPWGGGGGVEKIGRPDASYLATFPQVLHPEGL
jgi:cell wall-associated NlpC family hydrolase